MALFLLDSTVIIDALNGKKDRGQLLAQLARQGNTLACCAINIAEVYAGLKLGQERPTDELLRSLELLDITWEVARDAGLLRRHYRKEGRTLTLADCLVGTVALHYNAVLITDNVKDFPMSGLQLYPLPQRP